MTASKTTRLYAVPFLFCTEATTPAQASSPRHEGAADYPNHAPQAARVRSRTEGAQPDREAGVQRDNVPLAGF